MINKLIVFHPSTNLVKIVDELICELKPDCTYKNVIVPDLLDRAIATGITDEIKKEIAAVISEMPTGQPYTMLCTCSTLGGYAEKIGAEMGRRVVRIDRAMGEKAVDIGGRIGVAAALESTIQPTLKLLDEIATKKQKRINPEIILCREAWRVKSKGDDAGYIDNIVKCLEEKASGFDVIVLAQGSMAPAADRCLHLDIPILSSPRMGVEMALEMTGC